tara:strand:+ start:8752 stop:9483 length:732 start_codon:yes stop_codon:yes gene_type:complete
LIGHLLCIFLIFSGLLYLIDVIDKLKNNIQAGNDWVYCLMDAIGEWSTAEETYRGKTFTYFIAGEAFDWQLLAQRLCASLNGLIPKDEKEDLLILGVLPQRFGSNSIASLIKSRAGHAKYRGFLNYYYGVIVEDALQTVVEQEINKQNISRSAKYISNDRAQAFIKIYGHSTEELLNMYKLTTRAKYKKGLSLMQHREFTYWLFKFRVKNSDKAKVASDTTKGLNYLERINNMGVNSRINSVA